MAVRYYDDAIIAKLKKWIPDTSTLRVLGPDESKRFFETVADDRKDKPIRLPMVSLSRSKDIELKSSIKSLKSFDGLAIGNKQCIDAPVTAKFNVIPITLNYQLDIYTKTQEEGDEYVRNFLFKLINNPTIIIDIPYNNANIHHIANLRILSTVSDTSDISEHLFAGQFTRWTIQFEVQDAFLFSIPYRKNWHFGGIELETLPDNTIDLVTADCAWSEQADPNTKITNNNNLAKETTIK